MSHYGVDGIDDRPTLRERVDALWHIVVTDMQLNDLALEERRSFIYAYRIMLRDIMSGEMSLERRRVLRSRIWAMGGGIIGFVGSVILHHFGIL